MRVRQIPAETMERVETKRSASRAFVQIILSETVAKPVKKKQNREKRNPIDTIIP